MSCLLLGANGQVGRELQLTLPALGPLQPATRNGRLHDGSACENVDLTNARALTALLDRLQPRLIVNAAAYTAVDRAEDEEPLARRVNGEAPATLGTWAARHAVPVVHYSTDYVFNGSGSRPWREDDPVEPLGAYGRSKLEGERALAASGAPHLILRTAWVYAAHGHNFLRTMLRLGAERDRLTVVDDQHGSPTPAPLIASTTAAVLTRWLALDGPQRRERGGIYHLVSSGHTTWCGFARAIMARAVDAGLLPRAPEVAAVGSDHYPTPARRPAWSVLDTHKLRATFGLDLPSWQDGLDAVIGELTAAT